MVETFKVYILNQKGKNCCFSKSVLGEREKQNKNKNNEILQHTNGTVFSSKLQA